MRWILSLVFLLSASGCDAQIQKWQRERTVEHLSRLTSYQGHYVAKIGDESFDVDVWFQSPNRFMTVTKEGEIVRSDGSTYEVYDPKTKLHTTIKNLPPVTDADAKQTIRDLFDQNMKVSTFTLGPLGKHIDLPVIELRSKAKGDSIVQETVSQIHDPYSFPLKAHMKLANGKFASYEFTSIKFNEKFALPKADIPTASLKVTWDLNDKSETPENKAIPQGLKLVKTVKHALGMTMSYYNNAGQFLSVIRYKNLGMIPKRGIEVKVGKETGYLFPGVLSNTLTVSSGDTTSIYTSNLIVDDLIQAAGK